MVRREMIKLAIKHKIIEAAIETFFSELTSNLICNKTELSGSELNDSHIGIQVSMVRRTFSGDKSDYILKPCTGTIQSRPYLASYRWNTDYALISPDNIKVWDDNSTTQVWHDDVLIIKD